MDNQQVVVLFIDSQDLASKIFEDVIAGQFEVGIIEKFNSVLLAYQAYFLGIGGNKDVVRSYNLQTRVDDSLDE
jgi:hypothetical protein